MRQVSTRPARPVDSEFAFQTRKAAFRPALERVAAWDEQEQRQQHARRYATHEFAILECAGEDVGVVALARTAEEIRLHQLFVLPAHQGRGIGTAYVHQLVGEARAAQLPIRLQVLIVNERAIAFYERLGFANTGAVELHITMAKSP